ncbi:hypothetical protein [Paenibacillus planticolens]|uniref:Uncharacterized protein n=1 Tax=Paenibacillus planticolens TaxID=2654976 RepID=A0ABX1ZLJ9_9BACL|nr:hypothetical protein [Paenibacillus planticolens]NOV00970.1 hypothetical protein [Paenibacillus planticolens]
MAALVERITNHETVITLIHTGLDESREVVIQAGSFGEHTFTHATWSDQNGEEIGSFEVDDKWLQIKLEPGSGLQLKLRTVRYANSPSYATPWSKPVSLIQGRKQ